MDDCINIGKKLNNNGNRNTRELLWYTIGKLDKMDNRFHEKLDEVHKQINIHSKQSLKASILSKISIWVSGLLITSLVTGKIFGFF